MRNTWKSDPNMDAISKAVELLNSKPESAISELTRLAKEGSKISAWYLGDYYFKLKSQKVDLEKAKFWYDYCKIDDPSLDYTLGLVNEKLGNSEIAYNLFKRSSDKGYFPGSHKLGLALLTGTGINKDEVAGYELIKTSSNKGYLPAKRSLSLIFICGKKGFFKIPIGIFMFLQVTYEVSVKIFRNESLYDIK